LFPPSSFSFLDLVVTFADWVTQNANMNCPILKPTGTPLAIKLGRHPIKETFDDFVPVPCAHSLCF
jgi:DNA mismatch repair ATPase MutS